MQLSEFVKILYPYLGNGRKHSEFLLELLDYITEENEDEAINAVYDMKSDFLNRIYTGKEDLPKKRASVLLSHLDKLRFSDYLDDRLSFDAAEELRNKLSYIDMEYSNISVMCADIFTEILHEIASPTKKISVILHPEQQKMILSREQKKKALLGMTVYLHALSQLTHILEIILVMEIVCIILNIQLKCIWLNWFQTWPS